MRAAEIELKAIRRFELDIPKYTAEEIYGRMHSEKQKLITPVEEPLENFIAAWKAVDYQKKAFRDGDPDYAPKTAKKIVSYEQNGIYIGENLIVTFETLKTPLDQLTIAKKIERHLR